MNRDGQAMGFYHIDGVTANARGGFIKLTILGKDQCTGHSQTFQFNWSFDRDVYELSGKTGDRQFGYRVWIDGSRDQCMDANPTFHHEPLGDLLAGIPRRPNGGVLYGQWPFKQPKDACFAAAECSGSRDYRGPFGMNLNSTARDDARWGMHFDIPGMLGTPWWSTTGLNVVYLWSPVKPGNDISGYAGGFPASNITMRVDGGGGGWNGVFTQRGSSTVWDGMWTKGPTERVPTVMQGSAQGNRLTLRRTSSADGRLCAYSGTLGADGVAVSLVQTCPGMQTYNLTAKLVR